MRFIAVTRTLSSAGKLGRHLALTLTNPHPKQASSTLGGSVRLVSVGGPLLGGCTHSLKLLLYTPAYRLLLSHSHLTGCGYTSSHYRFIVGAYGVAAAFWTQALLSIAGSTHPKSYDLTNLTLTPSYP